MQSNTFDLFIIPGALPPVIHLAQYDNARTFEASLKNADGSAYMPPEGMTATFEGTNRLGGQYQIECEVDGANVTFTPDGNATNQWGRTAATITLRDGDDQITALNIIVDVQRAGVTNEEAVENPGFTDRIAQALTEYGALLAANQAAKTAEMTSPVGVDAGGKLWYVPGSGGGGSVETVNDIAPDANGNVELSPSDIGAYQKPSGGIQTADLAATIQESLMLANEAYQLPASGIPESDLSSAVKGKLSVANPAGAATATLSKLNVGGTIYSIPQGGGGGVTKYTVTFSGSAPQYTASMSSSEIYTAVQGGNIVEAVLDGETLTLSMSTSSAALFVGHALTESEFIGLAIAISGTAALTTTIPIQPKSITDAGGYYTTDTVEGALAEIGAQLDGLEDALSGINDVLEGAL